MIQPHFYLVIIGTEILNGRRKDAHFDFVKDLLLMHNASLFGTFIIEDDANLIKNIFTMIKKDLTSVLFSFGGIGSTPDDLTRQIACEVFSDQPLQQHQKFAKDIIERFQEAAYPNRINMAMLPIGSQLLLNPVNNMSGFQLENRFFFVPGFPEMSHPMIKEAVTTYFSNFTVKHRLTLTALCSEDALIPLMKALPDNIELSSLPQFVDQKPKVVISLSTYNKKTLETAFEKFEHYLKDKKITYSLGDILN